MTTDNTSPGKGADSCRLSLTGLAALVFGMMVGSGIFNIPQNMAAGAGLGASVIGWIVTALGMLSLVSVFRLLSLRRPQLNKGIFLYAEKGFHPLAGFCVAWGYWLCACFANVAFVVMLNDTFGAFFPVLLGHGTPTFLLSTLLIWGVYFIMRLGIRVSSIINTIASAIKMGVIALIVVMLILNVKYKTLTADIWCLDSGIGGVMTQVKSTMMVTLWCFIGIEGAVVMSGRARRQSDVRTAGVLGFLSAWLLYVLVSVFSYGIMSRADLAALDNPSVAYVLRACCGGWAYWLVIISIIISISGGLLAWMLVTAEQPCAAARHGVFPRWLVKNGGDSLNRSLLASSIVMQAFLMLVIFAEDMYLYSLNITGIMILPAYLFCGLYMIKVAREDRRSHLIARRPGSHYAYALFIGILCTIFCLWMIYAAGLSLLLQALGFYFLGLPFYRRLPQK